MSWVKTNMMLTMNESDATIAELITDGCNMGVKSLNKYLNQYTDAGEEAKEIAKRLIQLESELAVISAGFSDTVTGHRNPPACGQVRGREGLFCIGPAAD